MEALFLFKKAHAPISSLDDDRLYELFYPDKFKYKIRYTPVDYSYVHTLLLPKTTTNIPRIRIIQAISNISPELKSK